MPTLLSFSFRKLTRRVTALSHNSKAHTEYTNPEPLEGIIVIMADGEEDYSSLPLTDRWVHKVDLLLAGMKQGVLMWFYNRSGKYESKHMRMLQSNSRAHPTRTIPSSDLS